MAGLIARFDWGATSLGPIATWPAARRFTVNLMLGSETAIATLWGKDGIMIYNDAYAEIVAGRHPSILGIPVEDAFPEVAEFNRSVLDQVLAGGTLRLRDQELILKRTGEPERCWFDLSYSPIPRDCGSVDGVFAILTETTEQVLVREQVASALRQSQKMEAIGQLTGGIAHDFNNLLAGILGNLDMMATRLEQGKAESAISYLDGARSAASRAAGLTHRLLAFSRRQTLMPCAITIPTMLADMEELISRTAGPTVEVKTRYDSSVCRAFCDHNQLENALLNLAINARDAMEEGGSFTIAATNTTITAASAPEGCEPGDYVLLSVTDTGKGMSPDLVERAFDPFFTTKPSGQGTGLGLSMVYGFIKQSGGHIDIASRPGHGTTIRLFLPREAGQDNVAPIPVVEAPPEIAPIARPGETILIVDDEPDLRALLADMLAELGFIILEAIDADGGLTIVRSNAKIDLLVADIGLPGGMNGTQFAEAARYERPDLPVLFVTGFTESSPSGQITLDAKTSLLQKPFSFRSLHIHIDKLLESGRSD